jgi:hypothetical protein
MRKHPRRGDYDFWAFDLLRDGHPTVYVDEYDEDDQSFLCYDLDPKTGYPAILKGYRVRKCRELHLRPDNT